MHVLITNLFLRGRSGTETHTYDLAVELRRRGVGVSVFSPDRDGPLVPGLRAAGVEVVADPRACVTPPDIIHGHHNLALLTALTAFPQSPAVFVCHDAKAWHDRAPRLSQVACYAAVDDLCRERVAADVAIPLAEVAFHGNSVDLLRFQPRGPLPVRPLRALAFSNYAAEETFLPLIRTACSRAGLQLDTIGVGSGNPSDSPETDLPRYDVVFAKARCAMEALACGCAVVLCGDEGIGPLVTPGNFHELRRWNFGRRTLTSPHDVEALVSAIEAYDAPTAEATAQLARQELSLTAAVDAWLARYEAILAASAERKADNRDTGIVGELLQINTELDRLHVVTSQNAWYQRKMEQIDATPKIRDVVGTMPFIVGAPRSGTTLLRLMLDSHPWLAIPPETGFLFLAEELGWAADIAADEFVSRLARHPANAPHWPDFNVSLPAVRSRLPERTSVAAGLRAFYAAYADRFGKPLGGDKTPDHTRSMATTAAHLPEARFLHIIRDGRDAILSWQKTWFAPSQDIESLAREWATRVRIARKQRLPAARYLEVRYEALITSPETVLREICTFLNLPFAYAMLEYHKHAPQRLAEHQSRHRADGTVVATQEQRLSQQRLTCQPPQTDRVGGWRRVFTREDNNAFHRGSGNLLAELGYGTEYRPITVRERIREFAGRLLFRKRADTRAE
ncbi:MAG: hypothetical protein C0467_12995 [Planctomycetaceae bacterium]|nr:hypothetical protein [Planctomycetaceae bacterium]